MILVLGLGSNVGDRRAQLTRAVHEIAGWVTDLRLSSIYESAAMLMPGSPSDWDMPFYNMAVAGECDMPAELVLEEIKMLERKLGRTPTGLWGPREIDIDILAYGSQVVAQDGLAIPHKELLQRDFAMMPLADVAPDWKYPSGDFKGKEAQDLVALLGMKTGDGLERLPLTVS